MKIAVIGAGHIGRTLGGKWIGAGHDVVFGVRSPGAPGTAPIADATAGAEAVLLAIPGAATRQLIAELGHTLDGKVVIDATNDVQGAGRLRALDELGDGALPVRAFNTLGWENFADPTFGDVTADLFYAAEEGHAKEVADGLISDIGLRPVWIGAAEAFDLVDSLARLWFTLAFQRKLGRRVALKLLVDE